MIDRVLLSLFAGCAAFAGLIVVEAVSGSAERVAVEAAPVPAKPRLQPRVPEPRNVDLAAGILAAPLFSPSRRPAAAAERPAELTGIRLSGIVIEPDRRLAIFAVAGAKPVVRREGETVNEWRLESIAPWQVVLSGPAGSQTLLPKGDTGLVRPAPIAAAAAQPTPLPPPIARQVTSGVAPRRNR